MDDAHVQKPKEQTCTKNVSLDLLRGDEALRVAFRDISLEVRISNHLSKAGASSRMAKKTLREEENKL